MALTALLPIDAHPDALRHETAIATDGSPTSEVR